VPYNGETPPDLTLYAAAVRAAIAGLDVDVVIEPGRALVAEAGILLSRVIYMKSGTTKRFAIIDAAMNDLLRPAMYDAYHPMRPVKEPAPGAALVTVDVVGPVCETGDRLAQDRPLPPLADGDLIAIFMAGAYGAVMSSAYNSRPLAPEILVNGRQSALVRPRQSVDELIAADALPPWLDTPRGARVRSAG
jgi:diaminopimelate decarboxylase